VRVLEAGKGWQRELEHTLLDDGDVLLCEDHLETVSTISMHQTIKMQNEHTLSVSLGLAGWRSRVVVTIRVQSQKFRRGLAARASESECSGDASGLLSENGCFRACAANPRQDLRMYLSD
jgi:hypothetical protein